MKKTIENFCKMILSAVVKLITACYSEKNSIVKISSVDDKNFVTIEPSKNFKKIDVFKNTSKEKILLETFNFKEISFEYNDSSFIVPPVFAMQLLLIIQSNLKKFTVENCTVEFIKLPVGSAKKTIKKAENK